MASKTQVKNFIDTVAPIAVKICNKKTRKVLPSVCIAQACCESAYGTSTKMIRANALFGIKVGKSQVKFGTAWKGKSYSTKTKECYDGSTYQTITDFFRAYDTIEEAIEDYYDMLGNCSRYKACIGVTNPEKCITAIKNAGYATAPDYITTITTIIKTYNLTQYDACMTSSNKSDIPAAPSTTPTKFKLGEKVSAMSYYPNSQAEESKVIEKLLAGGTVSRIVVSAKHPYLISKNGVAIGWADESALYSGVVAEPEILHKVVAGDTLNKISAKYGVPVNTIISKNKSKYSSISASFIRVGWELRIK